MFTVYKGEQILINKSLGYYYDIEIGANLTQGKEPTCVLIDTFPSP